MLDITWPRTGGMALRNNGKAYLVDGLDGTTQLGSTVWEPRYAVFHKNSETLIDGKQVRVPALSGMRLRIVQSRVRVRACARTCVVCSVACACVCARALTRTCACVMWVCCVRVCV